MKYTYSGLALAGFVSSVAAHGFVTSPQARMPGDAFTAACGQQAHYNQAADNYGNIQGLLQVAATQSDFKASECEVWLCKAYKFADNTANVQSYTAGQSVDFKVDIRAPHTGTANVSIVDTASNTVIGQPLISWDVYASTASSIPTSETSFSVTIPSDLGSKCSEAGACVLQWFWDARSIDQTYESCIDFTVGGSSSGSGSASSAPAPSSTPISSQIPAVSSSPVSSPAPVVSSSPASSSAIPTEASSSACTRITGAALSPLTAAHSSSPAAVTQAPSSVISKAAATVTQQAATPVITSEVAQVTNVLSALPGLQTAIPSEVLTSALPTLPTASATGSATTPSVPLPEGTTLQDLLEWLDWILRTYFSRGHRKHARDMTY